MVRVAGGFSRCCALRSLGTLGGFVNLFGQRGSLELPRTDRPTGRPLGPARSNPNRTWAHRSAGRSGHTGQTGHDRSDKDRYPPIEGILADRVDLEFRSKRSDP